MTIAHLSQTNERSRSNCSATSHRRYIPFRREFDLGQCPLAGDAQQSSKSNPLGHFETRRFRPLAATRRSIHTKAKPHDDGRVSQNHHKLLLMGREEPAVVPRRNEIQAIACNSLRQLTQRQRLRRGTMDLSKLVFLDHQIMARLRRPRVDSGQDS